MMFKSVQSARLLAGFCGFLSVAPVQAATVLVPAGAEAVSQLVEPSGSYALPIGPWAEGSMLTRHTEGRIVQTAWRWSDTAQSTLDLLKPLRAALEAGGWSLLYECEGLGCGGFDFRYSTRVLPEPDMHVDLSDFRYIAARKGRGDQAQMISLLVSRSEGAQAGFAQTIEIGPAAAPEASASLAPEAPLALPLPDASALGAQLSQIGRVVVPGLSFSSSGAGVAGHDPAALKALADWLVAHPGQDLTLVGHSDTSGSAEANTTLSRRRAESLRQMLVQQFGVNARRLQTGGVGHLAPLVSNDTPEGRAQNRRVEAIVTPGR